jgi:hypothetical protein
VAFVRGYYRTAQHWYEIAGTGARGVMATELANKQVLAARRWRQQIAEWVAWLIVVAAIAYFLLYQRIWRQPNRLWVPTEVLYLLPVYALLLVCSYGHDAAVAHALVLVVLWSPMIVGSAGLAMARRFPCGRQYVVFALTIVLANCALFFAVCNRAGVIDRLLFKAG